MSLVSVVCSLWSVVWQMLVAVAVVLDTRAVESYLCQRRPRSSVHADLLSTFLIPSARLYQNDSDYV